MRRLAEPNLIGLSCDTARFLAGGELPVPAAVTATTGTGADNQVQEVRRQSCLCSDRIGPRSDCNAQTTVELRDSQSFSIAGVLQSSKGRSIE